MGSALVVKGATTVAHANGNRWEWMRIYMRNGSGQLVVTMLDNVLISNSFRPMYIETTTYTFDPRQ